MTTITIKNDYQISFKKHTFEDLNDFLNTLKQDVSDYSDPDFTDTVLTAELLKKAAITKEKIKTNPESFFEV